jgi:hypothetical protein
VSASHAEHDRVGDVAAEDRKMQADQAPQDRILENQFFLRVLHMMLEFYVYVKGKMKGPTTLR